MSNIKRMLLYDTAVYWPIVGRDDSGRPKYGNPVELAPPNGVRWQTGSEQKIMSDKEERFANDEIYVGVDLEPGWMIWHGKEADLKHPTRVHPDAVRIVAFNSIPNRRNTERLRWALT